MLEKIQEIQQRIYLLDEEIKTIQNNCDHPHLVSIDGGNTGNWCPQDDCYWTDFDCPDCLKKWTVYDEEK